MYVSRGGGRGGRREGGGEGGREEREGEREGRGGREERGREEGWRGKGGIWGVQYTIIYNAIFFVHNVVAIVIQSGYIYIYYIYNIVFLYKHMYFYLCIFKTFLFIVPRVLKIAVKGLYPCPMI